MLSDPELATATAVGLETQGEETILDQLRARTMEEGPTDKSYGCRGGHTVKTSLQHEGNQRKKYPNAFLFSFLDLLIDLQVIQTCRGLFPWHRAGQRTVENGSRLH